MPVQLAMVCTGLFVSILTGIAMLKAQNWGRLLYVLWGVVGTTIGVLVSRTGLMMIPGAIAFLVFAFFLFRPKANAFFAARWGRSAALALPIAAICVAIPFGVWMLQGSSDLTIHVKADGKLLLRQADCAVTELPNTLRHWRQQRGPFAVHIAPATDTPASAIRSTIVGCVQAGMTTFTLDAASERVSIPIRFPSPEERKAALTARARGVWLDEERILKEGESPEPRKNPIIHIFPQGFVCEQKKMEVRELKELLRGKLAIDAVSPVAIVCLGTSRYEDFLKLWKVCTEAGVTNVDLAYSSF